jgi:hypothetical protein
VIEAAVVLVVLAVGLADAVRELWGVGMTEELDALTAAD